MSQTIFRNCQATGFLIAAVLLVAAAPLAQAQLPAYLGYWNVPSGNWSNSTNWNSVDNTGTGSPGVPWSIAYIDNGGTATIDSTSGTVSLASEAGSVALTVGDSTGSGYVNMSGGTLAPNSNDFNLVEQLGSANSGVFAQSGGVHCPYLPYNDGQYSSLAIGIANGGYGAYNLSGGSLGVNVILLGAPDANSGFGSLGGTGVFTQTGGSIGSFGTKGAPNNPIGLMIGGNWAGMPGQGTGSSNKTVTDVGSYTLNASNGPSLIVAGVEVVGVNGTGSFTQSGGTNAIVGGGQNAGYPNLSLESVGDSNFDDAYGALLLGYFTNVGKTGSGSSQNKYAGNGVGYYTLSGGLLTGSIIDSSEGWEVVGCGGTGIFNQTGGTNYTGDRLSVGGDDQGIGYFAPPKGGQGWYNLSNGLMNTSGLEIGESGTGTFTQTGGTNINTAITIGGQSNIKSGYQDTNGTYNLNGGLLQTSIIQAGSRDDGTLRGIIFNFTGGTLQASSVAWNPGLNNQMPITVGTAAGNVATIDANGQTVWLNSNYQGFPLAGPGNLTLLDSASGGTFVLGGTDNNGNAINNNYAGGTTVLSGTLEVQYGGALPAGILTVGGPTAVVLSAQAGTMFGNDAVAQAAALGDGVGIASASPVADVSGSSIPVLADGVSMVPAAGGPAAVPEPSTIALLGAGVMCLLTLARRRKAA